MKAVVCTKYGSPEVLQLKEVPKPVPKSNEVCIKIHATAVTASDIIIRGSKLPMHIWLPMRLMVGLTKPRNPILGLIVAGEIELIGKEVKQFKKDDQVYGFTGFSFGSYAEYICLPETESKQGCLALKPTSINYNEAAAVTYGGILATHYVNKGKIKHGQKVLIYGASGAIGTTAVQLAKFYGAEVTAVCSGTNIELVKSLGADKVIDYTKKSAISPGECYDFILDAVGKSKSSALKSQCKKALSAGGKYISVDDGSPKLQAKYLEELSKLIDQGHIKSVIDRTYSLEQIVEAHNYVEQGHKKGNVVITI